MLSKLRPRSVYDVLAVIGCFAGLATGGAYAANTVFSADIVDNQVYSADVRNDSLAAGGLTAGDLRTGSVGSSEVLNDIAGGGLINQDLRAGSVGASEVINNSLGGDDINEAGLATVPASVLGGLGFTGERQDGQPGQGFCNPEDDTFVNCNMVARLNLPRPARVLVIGSVNARTELHASNGLGQCHLGTTAGPIPHSTAALLVENAGAPYADQRHASIAGIKGVLPAGQHAVGIDCNEIRPGIEYFNATVSAVALSDR
jgi:hypothetical protein